MIDKTRFNVNDSNLTMRIQQAEMNELQQAASAACFSFFCRNGSEIDFESAKPKKIK